MANTGFKGLDIRQTGGKLLFRAYLVDPVGAALSGGTTQLNLYEFQDDGTILTYDFNDNTFKSGTVTSINLSMGHRAGNNGTVTTGIWTIVLSTVSGFTIGAIYLAVAINSSASPVQQVREFQYGGLEGDLSLQNQGAGLAYQQTAISQGGLDFTSINGATRGFLTQQWLFSSASTSPSTGGYFTPYGSTLNNRPTYQGIGNSFYLWYSTSLTAWVISGAIGTPTGQMWSSSGADAILGPYSPSGGATGTQTFTPLGIPLSKNLPYLSVDSSGRLLLQPTQAGVTIPTVTEVNVVDSIPDSAGTGTLLGRLTSARAGYLDNLNVGGLVASHQDLLDISATAYFTVTPAQAAAAQVPQFIACTRGDTLSIQLPALGTLTGYSKILFTAKEYITDADSASKIQVVLALAGTTGLIYLNGSPASDHTLASIAIVDATTGLVNLTIAASVTAQLSVGEQWLWDCRVVKGTIVSTPVAGSFTVNATVTQSIS